MTYVYIYHIYVYIYQNWNMQGEHQRMITIQQDISKNTHTKVDSYLVQNICNLYLISF